MMAGKGRIGLPGMPAGEEGVFEAEERRRRGLFAALELQFEGMEDGPMRDAWGMLLAEGWDADKGLVMAWRAVPRAYREPKTILEVAGLLGVSDRTIRKWFYNNPHMEARLKKIQFQYVLDRIPEAMEAMAEVAAQVDPRAHPDRKTMLAMAGYVVGRTVEERRESGGEIEEMDNEELRALAEVGGVNGLQENNG